MIVKYLMNKETLLFLLLILNITIYVILSYLYGLLSYVITLSLIDFHGMMIPQCPNLDFLISFLGITG